MHRPVVTFAALSMVCASACGQNTVSAWAWPDPGLRYALGAPASEAIFLGGGAGNSFRYDIDMGRELGQGMVVRLLLDPDSGPGAPGRHSSGLEFNGGRLSTVLVRQDRSDDGAVRQTTLGGASYDLGRGKTAYAYGLKHDEPGWDNHELLLGASATRGADTLMISWLHRHDRNGLRQPTDQLAVGYNLALSRRMHFYTYYGPMTPHHGAPYTLNALERGNGGTGLALGLYYKF